MLAFPAQRWAISISWFCKLNMEQERLAAVIGTYVQLEIEDTTDKGRFPNSWLKEYQISIKRPTWKPTFPTTKIRNLCQDSERSIRNWRNYGYLGHGARVSSTLDGKFLWIGSMVIGVQCRPFPRSGGLTHRYRRQFVPARPFNSRTEPETSYMIKSNAWSCDRWALPVWIRVVRVSNVRRSSRSVPSSLTLINHGIWSWRRLRLRLTNPFISGMLAF